MGRILLLSRLAVRDLRRRRIEAALLLLAIMAGTTTLTLGLVLRDAASDPYQSTREATRGPDVVVSVGRSMSSHQTWNVCVGPSNWNSAQIHVLAGTSLLLSLSVQSPELPLSVPTPNALNWPPKRMTAGVPVPAPSASE